MFEFLVGDFAIFAGTLLFVYGIWRLFPTTVGRIVNDQPAARRYLNRAVFGTGAAAILWITLFDNWRQVLGIPTGWLQDDRAQRASDPFYSGTISDPVRALSWILFLLAVAGGAYFFARYARGLAEPIILGPVAVVFFFILNTFRLRFDVDSVRIAYGTIDSPLDIATTLIWISALMVTMGLLVLAMYIIAWSPAAIALSIVYRRFIDRATYEEPPIFRKMRENRMTRAEGS